MNSPAPPHDRQVDHYPQNATQPTVTNHNEAANNRADQSERLDPHAVDAPEESDIFQNPLWIVTFGMACMLGVMALVLALS